STPCSSHFSLSCFNWDARHDDLNSFPTRRSSDLLFRKAVGPLEVVVRVHPAAAVGPAFAFELGALAWGAELGHTLVPPRRPQRRDRKSTRLNSSHVKSSYAVFCLKKKKTTITKLA